MIATPLFASFISGLLGFSMFAVSLFLILLILVQRGRGGGLTGALGGPGGQSAFGTKAGDLFTRITSFVALGWITLCAFTMWLLGPDTTIQADAGRPEIKASPTDAPPSSEALIDLGNAADTPAGETRPNVELTPATGETAPATGETAPATGEPASAAAGDSNDAPAATPAAPETPAATDDAPAAEDEAPAVATPADDTPE
ncbi:MAG: preprotein translocase subunit SecG [Planctomycetaceae bacterium]